MDEFSQAIPPAPGSGARDRDARVAGDCSRPRSRPLRRARDQPGRVREHETGRSALRLADQRDRRFIDPGLRDPDERQRRPDGELQDQNTGELVPHRHPPARVLRRRRSAVDPVEHQTLGDPPANPAGLHDDQLDRPGRMRQLGGLGLLGGALERRLGPLHRASGAQRHRRREPDLLRRPRRLQPLRRRPQDLRHDLAGLQRLRWQQPLLLHGLLSARGKPAATRPPTRSPTTARSTAASPWTAASRTRSTPSTS